MRFFDASDAVVVLRDGSIVANFDGPACSDAAKILAAAGALGDSAVFAGVPTSTECVTPVDVGVVDADEQAAQALRNSELRELKTDEVVRDQSAQATTAPTATKSSASSSSLSEEARAIGSVPWHVYREYFSKCGVGYVVGCGGLLLCARAINVGTDWVLAQWSSLEGGYTSEWYATVYALLSAGGILISTGFHAGWAAASLRGAARIHDALLRGLLRAPIPTFYDITPSGRIVNRCAADIETVDTRLPVQIGHTAKHVAAIFMTVAVQGAVLPPLLAAFVVVALLYLAVQNAYRPAARDIQRLLSVARSPVHSHFSEALSGGVVIRAFGEVEAYRDASERHVARMLEPQWQLVVVNRWLSVRLTWLGTVLIVVACAAAAATTVPGFATAIGAEQISPGLVGLALAYTMRITTHLMWLVRNATASEAALNAVERTSEYSSVTPEAASVVESELPPERWPSGGAISFSNVRLRYREGLPQALRGVSFNVPPRAKVGIVGRTGSGKSSVVQALFRLAEPEAGSRIDIDGVNILRVGLHNLRSRLSIVPQSPVIFLGSVRYNLDPLHLADDARLWDALRVVRLAETVAAGGGLDMHLEAGGANISVGESQLLCLARAVIRKSAVVVLDEASAHVDASTDAVLQDALRDAFAGSTVLTIAHRLETVSDCDLVLVLNDGVVAELDTTDNLLRNEGGLYASLVREAATRTTGADDVYDGEASGSGDGAAASAVSLMEST